MKKATKKKATSGRGTTMFYVVGWVFEDEQQAMDTHKFVLLSCGGAKMFHVGAAEVAANESEVRITPVPTKRRPTR